MSNQTIRGAFESRLTAWAAAQSLPVAWENQSFTPPATGIYLRGRLLPKKTESASLCGIQYQGSYRIDVMAPPDSGVGAADQAADQLADLFKAGSLMDGVRVTTPPRVRRGGADLVSGFYRIPVTVKYLLT